MQSVSDRVAAVGAMSPTALKAEWRRQFGEAPPDWPASLLARAITHAIQVKRHGDLPKRTAKYLDQIADAIAARAPTTKVDAPAKVRAGTRFVREWRGHVHHVEAMVDGRFHYEGRPYRSLSEIARHITGTQWSGPRFFGVR